MNRSRKLRFRRFSIITTKYVLATILSIHVAYWMGVIDFLSACFVAVLTLQPNLYRGISFSWEQVKLTTVAVLITVSVVWASYGGLHETAWIYQAAAAMGLVVLYSLWRNHQQGLIIGTFTVAYVTCLPQMIPGQEFFDMIHLRFGTIIIGIATATLINYGSALFRYRDRPYLQILSILRDLESVITKIIDDQDSSEPDQEDKYLTWVRPVFEQLHQLERDLEELRVEWLEWTLSPSEPVQRFQRLQTVLYGLKNTSHYLWGILLWKTHHGYEGEAEWRRALESAQSRLRSCEESIETGNPLSSPEEVPPPAAAGEHGPPLEEFQESLRDLGVQTSRLIKSTTDGTNNAD